MKNILDYVKKDQIFFDPFPHIVAHDVLPPNVYAELESTFPPLETVVDGSSYTSNQRFDYTMRQVRSSSTVPLVWKEFCEANASDSFFRRVASLFGEYIQVKYPLLASYGEQLEHMRIGTRYIDSFETADILLDAHVSINTPVTTKPTSVRVAHVDDPMKLYGGLFYFRKAGDNSTGGDLELYRYKRGDYKFYGQHVDYKYVERIKTVAYQPNTFVFFINTIDSLHGVTVREKTHHTRRFLNLVGEVKEPLFDILSLQENIWMKRYRRYKAKLTGQGGKW